MTEGNSMKFTVKRMGVLSFAKVTAALYTVLGFLGGALYALFFLAGGAALMAQGDKEGIAGIAVGAGAIICFPLVYGAMGFVLGALMAFIYNLGVSFVGGFELWVDAEVADEA